MLVQLYKKHITRYTPNCSQSPSCSDYALEHGITAALIRMFRVEGVRCGDKIFPNG